MPKLFFRLLWIFENLNLCYCVKNTLQFYTVVNKKYSWNPIIQKKPKRNNCPRWNYYGIVSKKRSRSIAGLFCNNIYLQLIVLLSLHYSVVFINTGCAVITDNAILSVPLGKWYFVLKFDSLPGFIKSGKTSSCSSTLIPLW